MQDPLRGKKPCGKDSPIQPFGILLEGGTNQSLHVGVCHSWHVYYMADDTLECVSW